MGVQDLVSAGPLFDVVTGLQGRLKTFFPPDFFAHQVVPAKLTPAIWAKLTDRTPMVGLGWGGVRPRKENARTFSGDALFTVFLVTRNAHSPAARLLGDRLGAGQIGVVQVAVTVLQGWSSGPAFGAVAVTDVANLSADGIGSDDTAIVAINLEVPVTMEIVGNSDLTEFLRVAVQWSFPDADGPADTIEVRS